LCQSWGIREDTRCTNNFGLEGAEPARSDGRADPAPCRSLIGLGQQGHVEPDGRPIAGRVAVTRERWQVADKESPATRRTQDAGRCWEPAPASHHPWNHHRLSLQYGPARTRVCWQIWSRTHALCRERDRHTYVRMLEGETQHLQLSLSLSRLPTLVVVSS
jgi:hypothetical protein